MSRSFPRPPGAATRADAAREAITNEDVLFILNTTLKPDHLDDPAIIGFIGSFISCRDVKQASLAAGVSPSRGQQIRNLKDVNTAIAKITETAVLKYGLDPADIVERVKEIANFDPADLTKPDGSFHENMRDIPAATRRAIKKFKAKNLYENDANGIPQVIGKLIEVEFWDKLKGNELLGRETNLFKETKVVTHDVTSKMKDLLLQSKERAEQRALEARNHPSLKMIDVTPKEVAVVQTNDESENS